MKPEQRLQNQVSTYLKAQYPDVMFMVSPSGIKLTMGQAVSLKKNQNPSKGWPDLLIMKTQNATYNDKSIEPWKGLFIELKPEGTTIYKKDGALRKNEHLEQQQKVHQLLQKEGYYADFSIGFENTKKLIDWYLK
jgi:hypothetical protein